MSRVSQNPMMVVLTALAAGMLSLAMQATAPMAVIPGNHSPDAVRMSGPQMAPSGEQLHMAVILKLGDPAGLNQLLRDQQNPRSPLYRHWLAKGEFAARFGPDRSRYAAVASWLRLQGFSVGAPDFTRRAVPFTGTVGAAEKSFGVRIVTVDHGVHYGNVNDPSVPAALAGAIGFIDGLDNLRAARPAPWSSTRFHPTEIRARPVHCRSRNCCQAVPRSARRRSTNSTVKSASPLPICTPFMMKLRFSRAKSMGVAWAVSA